MATSKKMRRRKTKKKRRRMKEGKDDREATHNGTSPSQNYIIISTLPALPGALESPQHPSSPNLTTFTERMMINLGYFGLQSSRVPTVGFQRRVRPL